MKRIQFLRLLLMSSWICWGVWVECDFKHEALRVKYQMLRLILYVHHSVCTHIPLFTGNISRIVIASADSTSDRQSKSLFACSQSAPSLLPVTLSENQMLTFGWFAGGGGWGGPCRFTECKWILGVNISWLGIIAAPLEWIPNADWLVHNLTLPANMHRVKAFTCWACLLTKAAFLLSKHMKHSWRQCW